MFRAFTTVLATLLMAGAAAAGPLHDAARAGDVSLVKQLATGSSIDERDGTGETPLLAAALAGQDEIVDLLLTLGADARLANDRGMSPLHAAAFAGDLEAVKRLQAAGADIGAADNKFGVTPLIVAAEENHGDVATYLIEAGADMEITERHGYTALTRAGYHDHGDMIALLLKAGAKCQEIDPLWLKACSAKKTELGL